MLKVHSTIERFEEFEPYVLNTIFMRRGQWKLKILQAEEYAR